MLSLCQYLVLQSWADLNPLLQKHGLIGEGHWFDERELRHDRQTTFNTLEHTVRTARPEAVSFPSRESEPPRPSASIAPQTNATRARARERAAMPGVSRVNGPIRCLLLVLPTA